MINYKIIGLFVLIGISGIGHADVLNFINATDVKLEFAVNGTPTCFTYNDNSKSFSLKPNTGISDLVRFDFSCYVFPPELASITYTVYYNKLPIFDLNHVIPPNAGTDGEQNSFKRYPAGSSCHFNVESSVDTPVYDETINQYKITGSCK